MIAILTNDGSLQIARALSGGELFLVYGAALLHEQFNAPYEIATNHATVAFDASGKESAITFGELGPSDIIAVVPCTGILPVKVSDGISSAMAVDFDFNTQLLDIYGLPSGIEYQSVCMLGRRYRQYTVVEYGVTYHYGDHVWLGGDAGRDTAYVCVAETYLYMKGMPDPDEDVDHWMPVNTENLMTHPGDPAYYSDPAYDTFVMHVTSYDEPMAMGNGLEWEYKVRVFLDNLLQKDISKIEKFAQGAEANGSLMLSFMAEISANFRALRDMATTSA